VVDGERATLTWLNERAAPALLGVVQQAVFNGQERGADPTGCSTKVRTLTHKNVKNEDCSSEFIENKGAIKVLLGVY
jgi:hypothetical protein